MTDIKKVIVLCHFLFIKKKKKFFNFFLNFFLKKMSDSGIGDDDVDCPGDSENQYDASIRKLLDGEDLTFSHEEAELMAKNRTIDLTQHQLLKLYILLNLPERVKEINIETLSKKQLEHFKDDCKGNKQLIDAVSQLQLKRSAWKKSQKKFKPLHLLIIISILLFVLAIFLRK